MHVYGIYKILNQEFMIYYTLAKNTEWYMCMVEPPIDDYDICKKEKLSVERAIQTYYFREMSKERVMPITWSVSACIVQVHCFTGRNTFLQQQQYNTKHLPHGTVNYLGVNPRWKSFYVIVHDAKNQLAYMCFNN